MPESVIVDDGGSTRIKWNLPAPGLGDMPKLLNGQPQTITSPFSTVRIAYLDESGIATNYYDHTFADKVEIFSGKKQRVVLKKAGNNLEITVYGDSVDAEPLVEAKQLNGKRRYIVSNAGAIEKVEVDGDKVYPPPGPGIDVLYTSVVVVP